MRALNTVPWEAMSDPDGGDQSPTLSFCRIRKPGTDGIIRLIGRDGGALK